MTKQEFMDKLKIVDSIADDKKVFTALKYDEAGEILEISNEDYLTIETVYTYHPAISEVTGKIQIATIYAYGGMAVIKDMIPTAVKARRIEAELQEIRAKEHNLRAELERLRKGEEVEIE